MAETQPNETDTEAQKDWAEATKPEAEAAADTAATETAAEDAAETKAAETKAAETKAAETETADEDDEDFGVPMDQVEAVLNATADKNDLTPQMRRMMARQAENTKRVEEAIKGTKSNPRWFVPLFCTLMVIGLIWCVAYYLTGNYPIPNIGAWNLAIGFAIIMVGFLMTMGWR
ncbi:cell division protein CrgA [Bifidobacterium samirii]|uniref:Cell division protein CrgA n=1 Tax=Bifidobacterium samirii TaxID=2306974 RepID=A0A430FV32_9BIFI|nr:cell division protein CrgA [Bifidobacterium samirii]RSX57411.1 septation inhibitor protein [Bifidobacterium samirii]